MALLLQLCVRWTFWMHLTDQRTAGNEEAQLDHQRVLKSAKTWLVFLTCWGSVWGAVGIVSCLILIVLWSGGCTPDEEIGLLKANLFALIHPSRRLWNWGSDSDIWLLSCHSCRELLVHCLHSLHCVSVFHPCLLWEGPGDTTAMSSLDLWFPLGLANGKPWQEGNGRKGGESDLVCVSWMVLGWLCLSTEGPNFLHSPLYFQVLATASTLSGLYH